MYSWRMGRAGGRSGSESSAASNIHAAGSGSVAGASSTDVSGRDVYEKRPSSATQGPGEDDKAGDGEQPKKKRRIVLTHLGSGD
jgi:hypothetical protein